jgi:hypothetical protein
LKLFGPFVGSFEDTVVDGFEDGGDEVHELLFGRLFAELKGNGSCEATAVLFDEWG